MSLHFKPGQPLISAEELGGQSQRSPLAPAPSNRNAAVGRWQGPLGLPLMSLLQTPHGTQPPAANRQVTFAQHDIRSSGYQQPATVPVAGECAIAPSADIPLLVLAGQLCTLTSSVTATQMPGIHCYSA